MSNQLGHPKGPASDRYQHTWGMYGASGLALVQASQHPYTKEQLTSNSHVTAVTSNWSSPWGDVMAQ